MAEASANGGLAAPRRLIGRQFLGLKSTPEGMINQAASLHRFIQVWTRLAGIALAYR